MSSQFFSPPISRRLFLASALGGMATAALPGTALAASAAGFVRSLWPQARARGISRNVFDAALGGFRPDPRVIELTQSQPEFAQSVEAYIERRVDERRIARGQQARAEWSRTLSKIEAEYGVSRDVILAIWGMETNYGGFLGTSNVIRSLATLTHDGYRETFFRNELLTALEILDAGHTRVDAMVGSWAGAMGHTQFMPSSFRQYAVDFDGDGRADLWNSVPDALASAANYLAQHGWRSGETWGYEIRLPDRFDFARAWQSGTTGLGDWQDMGVTRSRGQAFPRPDDRASLYLPAGANGPAFLTLPNFNVIKRYNNSNAYALSVGHLADRIGGFPAFAANWPQEEPLTRTDRRSLQEKLARLGFDPGGVDGVIGPNTRIAIIGFQKQAGILADGHANASLLQTVQRML